MGVFYSGVDDTHWVCICMKTNIPPVVSHWQGCGRLDTDREGHMKFSSTVTIDPAQLGACSHPVGAAPARCAHARGIPDRAHPRLLQRAAGSAARTSRGHRQTPRPERGAGVPLRAARSAGRGHAAGGRLGNVHILDGGITAWEGKGISTSIAAPNAGIWNARSAWWPAPSCSPASWAASPCPAQEVGRRHGRWIGRGCSDQHLCDGHAVVASALQPRPAM